MTIVASIAAAAPAAPAGGGALADECSQDFQKVTLCLDFATGKATTPSKKCCDAVEDIKERDPKCLCFVIQQAKTGGQALKDLGVQEDKLIQLPTACQLHNASITNCPSTFLVLLAHITFLSFSICFCYISFMCLIVYYMQISLILEAT